MEGGKGLQFYNEAEKAINQKSIFSMFGSSNSKFENASELYKNSGNAYKMDNAWQSAGIAFTKAAEACLKADNKNDAINHYVEAANCYKRISPVDAINTFIIAINMYVEGGRFGMCARYWKEIAEIYEGDHNETDAMAAYTKAADFFSKDNKAVNANQCLLKVATFGAEKGELAKSAEIFEKIAMESLSSKLGAFSAKGYFFQALQCVLATGDYVNVNRKLEAFKNADFSFGNCRECQFIEKLLKACEDLDSEAFADACSDFDRITALNPWQTSMLLKAKKHVADNSGEDVDLA